MGEVVSYQSRDVQTAAEMQTHVQRIQQVMQAVMKRDTHYGVIPYTDKPTLYKAGSEVLLTTFRVAVDPEVIDLSDDEHVRFRVIARGVHQTSGIVIGAGVGECSSAEEKYCWRDAICDEEFDDTDPDRRRVKYQKKRGGGHFTRKQIRTNPADVANTVLKMAKKRAQIDLTLTALAASDIFTQDVEDLPEGHQHMAGERTTKPATSAPQSNGGNGLATEKQIKLISVKLAQAECPVETFCEQFEISALEELAFGRVNEALEYIAEYAES